MKFIILYKNIKTKNKIILKIIPKEYSTKIKINIFLFNK